MVPLTSVSEQKLYIPARLEPSVPGEWRWVDPYLLQFQTPEGVIFPFGTSILLSIYLTFARVHGDCWSMPIIVGIWHGQSLYIYIYNSHCQINEGLTCCSRANRSATFGVLEKQPSDQEVQLTMFG